MSYLPGVLVDSAGVLRGLTALPATTEYLTVTPTGQLGSAPVTDPVWGAITGDIADQTDLTTAINNAISTVLDGAPGLLDTLNELAAAIGDDPNFATTVLAGLDGKLSLSGGTMTGALLIDYPDPVTTSQPAISIAQVWNNAAVSFVGMDFDFTDTASTSESRFLDLRMGGTSRLSITKYGTISQNTPDIADSDYLIRLRENGTDKFYVTARDGAYLNLGVSRSFGIYRDGIYIIQIGSNSTDARVQLNNNGSFCWNPNSAITGVADLVLWRDAAGVLAQRNGVNSQAFCLYNTYTDASNYERGFIRWASNRMEIGAEASGTGVVRTLHAIGDLYLGYAVANATDRTLFITGYSSHGIEFNAHNGWSKLQLKHSHDSVLRFTQTGNNATQVNLHFDNSPRLHLNNPSSYDRGICLGGSVGSSTTGGTISTASSAWGGLNFRTYAGVSDYADLRLTGAASTQIKLAAITAVPFVLEPAATMPLEVRNGTNAQIFRLYNTYTNASNYENLQFSWVSNEARIGTGVAGTGTQRYLALGHWNAAGTWTKRIDIGNAWVTLSAGDGSSAFGVRGGGYDAEFFNNCRLGFESGASGIGDIYIGRYAANVLGVYASRTGVGSTLASLMAANATLSGSLIFTTMEGVTSSNFTRISGSNQPTRGIAIRDGQVNFASNVSLYWSASLDPTANANGISLITDGISQFWQRSGTTAQAYYLSNTYTDASNYERGFARWNINVFEIGTEAAGTGSLRDMSILCAGYTFKLTTRYGQEIATFNAGIGITRGMLALGPSGSYSCRIQAFNTRASIQPSGNFHTTANLWLLGMLGGAYVASLGRHHGTGVSVWCGYGATPTDVNADGGNAGNFDIWLNSGGAGAGTGVAGSNSKVRVFDDDTDSVTFEITKTGNVTAATYAGYERSSDPSDPSEGNFVLWMSDGTGSGDDGDLMVKITAGSTTTTAVLMPKRGTFDTTEYDFAGTYAYYGGEYANGDWTIFRVTVADGTKVAASEANNATYTDLATAWTDRVSLTYA